MWQICFAGVDRWLRVGCTFDAKKQEKDPDRSQQKFKINVFKHTVSHAQIGEYCPLADKFETMGASDCYHG